MSDPRRLSILLLVPGPVGELMSGPAIRGWELARALAAHHDVTIAADVAEPARREGIAIVPGGRRAVARLARRRDVVLAPWLAPWLYLVLAGSRCLRIADLYDPVELEIATSAAGDVRAELEGVRELTRVQLRLADAIVCGGETMQERLAGDLAQLSPPRPDTPVRRVPFGVPAAASAAAPPDVDRRAALRRRLPQLADEDVVVVWWGGVWRWLDAGTALEAMRLLADRPQLKLVFCVGAPAHGRSNELSAVEETIERASELGLLADRVLFLREQIPYADRLALLAGADVGITLHRNDDEARLALRSRYFDYIAARLPAVLGRGDEIAAQLQRAGAAIAVAPGDAEAVAHALRTYADDVGARGRASSAAAEVAQGLTWQAVVRPLVELLDGLVASPPPRPSLARTATAVGRYYAAQARVRLRRRGARGSRAISRSSASSDARSS